jgi:COX assembly protein 2
MHTSLAPHLHTPKCNEIIKKLIECQKQNGKWKQFLFHTCDELDYQMRMCTKQERLDRAQKSIESSNVRNELIREKLQKRKAEGRSWRDTLDEK